MSNIEELFLGASQLPHSERITFLRENCPDQESFDRVSALLNAHGKADDFLESPPLDFLGESSRAGSNSWPLAADTQDHVVDETLSPLLERLFSSDASNPAKLDHYQVDSVIGSGGMGMVLKALDTKLQRSVAIKILPRNFHAHDRQRQRFIREAQTAAQLSHPNVVAVHAVEDQEYPFIVMELVQGANLNEIIKLQGPLDVEMILSVGVQIAKGLAAAHQRNLIHRDIKPGNILITDQGEVKIADFGLARELFDTELSQTGELCGTPQFMSPEQVEGETLDLRSDLFSLGTVLYCMCTGASPFADESMLKVFRLVRELNAEPVHHGRADIPRELSDLIEELMAKNPTARPESAEHVVSRFEQISHNTIQSAADENKSKQGEKSNSVKKNGFRTLFAAAIFLIILFGVSEATQLTRLSGMILDVIRVQTAKGTVVITVNDPNISVAINGNRIDIDENGKTIFEYKIGDHKIVASKDGKVILQKVITLRRDGKEIVSIEKEIAAEKDAKPDIKKIDIPRLAKNRSPIAGDPITISDHTHQVRSLSYSPDGKLLATAQFGGWIRLWAVDGAKTANDIQLMFKQRITRQSPYPVCFSPDGKILCSGVNRWEVRTQKKLPDFKAPVHAWSPKGDYFVTEPQKGVIEIHQVSNEKIAHSIETNQGDVHVCRFSSDGTLLATGGERSVRVWNVESGEKMTELQAGQKKVQCIEFSPDGKRLVAGGADHVAWMWKLDKDGKSDNHVLATFEGHKDNVVGATFLKQGQVLVTVSRESALTYPKPGKKAGQNFKFWDVNTGKEIWDQYGHSNTVTGVALRHDGQQLATCANDNRVKIWNLKAEFH